MCPAPMAMSHPGICSTGPHGLAGLLAPHPWGKGLPKQQGQRNSQPLCIYPALFGYPAELATLIDWNGVSFRRRKQEKPA